MFCKVRQFAGTVLKAAAIASAALGISAYQATATPFTTTVPGENIPLPDVYPDAGGVVIVMIGTNGNIYYQFSDPDGAFVGFQNTGTPTQFQGNPFTINDPIPLECGIRSCTDYFGGSIDRVYIRFSAYDGDTQVGGFDQNDISLILNGVNVGNWSNVRTESTNNTGLTSFGFQQGFGNNTFDTGWFSSTNPTLLNDILVSGRTTTQVFDRDPNDNYWDFTRGLSLQDEELRTIAPGYEFEKVADRTSFAAVGEQITYTYTVTNIGSVDINNIAVFDDLIPSITCDKTMIEQTTNGGPADSATCTGVYTITQEDYEAQSVTNIAFATGEPEYGTLGEVEDTATVAGPPVLNPSVDIVKTADRAAFSSVGEVITYTYTVLNDGDTTLTDITVTDDRIPGTICTVGPLVPQAPDNEATCTATYTVTQADLDAFAIDGTPLTNVATVVAQDPDGAAISDTGTETVDGPAAAPALVVEKSALQTEFDATDALIQFQILIINTGNVTWPQAPAITDPLVTDAGGSVICPTGPVAPGDTVTCTADYRTVQGDLDAEQIENIATAEITVGGVTASETDSVIVPAVIETGLDIVKGLPAGAETTFDAVGDQIIYEYVLTNTGTVSLLSPAITDDKVSVTCPTDPIAPGATAVCTSAPYTVTQADLDAGGVTNVATASAATQTGTPVDSDPTQLTVNADQTTGLALDKSAPNVPPGQFRVGQTITYTYQVQNTGNVTLTDPIIVTDDKLPAPFECAPAPIPPAPTAGSTVTCTANYTLTAEDIAAGLIINRATATSGAVTSNADTATISDAGAPDLGLEKAPATPGATFTTLGEPIDYVFTVTNTGETTITDLQPITVDDPKVGTVDCSAQPAVLDPGDSFECTGTYTGVSQAEIDTGEVVNIATASFTAPDGRVVTSPSSSATVTSGVVPALSLDKAGPASFGAVGSLVTYTFTVTNDSAQTIAKAEVTDPQIPSLSCSFTDIAPFDSVICSGDYTVTQEDLDRGSILNTATATGTAPTGELLGDTASETVLVDPAAQVRALSLDKTANVSSFTAPGDTIIYSFSVANTGTLTLSDILVEDPQVGLFCTIPTLAPQTSNDTSCFISYTVTQADIDQGFFENTATASAPDTPPSVSSVQTPGPVRTASLTVEKTANDTTDVQVGQVITYTHVVTNTGNTTLTDVTLTDTHTSASGTTTLAFSPSNVIATLAPGAAETLTTSYTVTQEDIDAGADLTNAVSATATAPAGVAPPAASDTETVDVQDAAPEVVVAKIEADGSGDFANLPTTETFTFEVTNTGNVTLTGLTLTDDLTGFSCDLADIPVGGSATTCLDSSPLSTTYTVTQDDIDANTLINVVTVTDGSVTATDTVTLDGPPQTVALSMVKTATFGANFSAVGDEITYDYVITNDGNITLRGPFSVADDLATVNCPITPVAGIAPGGTITCTATYAVTQADLDAGTVTNLATATITQSIVPGGPQTFSSAQQSETVGAAQAPALDVDKVITPGTPTTFGDVSESLSYDYTITNTGNVTIPAPITVDDDQIGTGLTCATAELAPGASVTCTHTWPVTQEAIDAGSITNVAQPVATFDGAAVPAGSDAVTAVAIQTPELEVSKTFVEITNNQYAAGETITYSFRVENTGNTTITTEPVIDDTIIDPANLSADAPFPAGGLAPGDVITYTGTYVLTVPDIQLGSVTNTATASADGTTSDPSSVTTPATANPALSIDKSTNATTFTTLNEQIVYIYEVTNTSDGSPAPALANDITVTDSKFPGVTITCDLPANGQLLVGESTFCEATYFVTQADLDRGEIVNNAVAQTTFGGQDVLSPFDQVVVTGAQTPALSLVKEVIAGNDPAAVGDVITYRMTATNTGNQTISNVLIDDPRIPDLTCETGGAPAPTVVNLAPQGVLICEGDYTVTQDDVDAQSLSNTATASGTNPQGVPVSADGTATQPIDPFDPSVDVVKALTSGEPGADYSAVGEEAVYTITVINDGNITLDTIDVTDSNVAGTCTVGPLAPGESDDSCTFVYTVQQTDIDRGFIDNTATAVAQPVTPDTDPVEDEDTFRAIGPLQEPSFALTKDADLTVFDATGTTITYTYVVANTGNVTLTAPPAVTDDRIDTVTCDPFPAGGLLPGEFVTCTGTDVTTQADLDAGELTNVASVSSADAPFDPANPGAAQATETVPAAQSPAVTMTKTPDSAADLGVGDTVTYSYTITNTGNVTLSNLTLDDQHTSASGTAPLVIQPSDTILSLAPLARETLTATYTLTQEDVDAGAPITNVATLTTQSPDGGNPTVSDTASVTPEVEAPALEVLKTVASSTGSAAGDTVTFAITVENSGNVTLSGIALTDTLRRQDGTLISPAPVPTLTDGDGDTLSPAEVWTYEISHTLTQADVDAGGLSNSARASAISPEGTPISDLSDTGAGTGSTATPFAIPPSPALEVEKTVAVAATEVGETVIFEITVANTGNVTLTDVAVTDDTLTRADGTPLALTGGPTFAGATLGSTEGTLMVDEVATYTASYTLTQEDLDAGGISNVATAAATAPNGNPTTDEVDTPAVVTIDAAPAITFDKTLSDGGPTFDAVGDVLSYSFAVTNVGNVTLTDPIIIDDPLITDAGGVIDCPAPPLAPLATAICTGSYAVTQADLDAGSVTNFATASAGDAAPVTDSTTTPAQQTPAVTVLKEAEELQSVDFVVGAEVAYTYTVTNTGNTTLTDPVTVDDNLIADVSCPALPAGGLAPGAQLACTASYTVTATDVQLASVTNLATASVGDIDSPQVSETIPVDGVPALTIAKTIASVTDAAGAPRAGDAFAEVGDLLTYTFEVTNTGEVSFANPVTVTDALIADPIACFTPTADNPDLTPGETTTCTATYTVTQEDLDAGSVLNSAFAQTTFGDAPPTVVSSPPDTETVNAATTPSIAVEKSVDAATYAAPGDVLTYTFTVTNTGNQTLRSVSVSDPLIPTLDCAVETLAPDAQLVCTDTLTITQENLDDTEVVNVASVAAITPAGGGVSDDSAPVTSTAPAGSSALSMVKSATPDPFGGVGTSITYGFAVTNDGPFTLNDVTITDPLVPTFSCVIPTLAVGATDAVSCRMPYTVTQEDVDRGFIDNTASATGLTDAGRTSTATDAISTDGPEAAPALEVLKLVSVPATTLGSVVTYTLTVENTGNVTLDAPRLTDTMTRIGTGAPVFLTTPFTFQSGDDGDALLDVGEVWTYTATYELTQGDINAGGISNTVTARSTDRYGTPASDTSDDGIDANGDDNPTLVPIIADPVLDVTKSIDTAGARPGDEVVFVIEAANRGNVDILDVSAADTLTRRDGTDLSAEVTGPVRIGANAAETVLSPGSSFVWQVTYTLTQADVDAGGIANVALVSGLSPGGDPVSDLSSDADDTDGNPADDPTELSITPAPSIDVVKEATSDAPTGAGDTVTFEVRATNTGNVSLSELSLTDTMTNADGAPLSPVIIAPAADTDVTLAAGDTFVWTVSYTLLQSDVDAGGVSNTATATGLTPTGLPVSDVSDDGDDTDGNDTNDPTGILIDRDPTLLVDKTATPPSRITGTLFETTFTITAENAGNVTQSDLSILDDMAAFVAPATLVEVSQPVVTGLSAGGANPGYDGVADIETLAPGSVLAVGDTATVDITVRFDIAAGEPGQPNTARVTSDFNDAPVTAEVLLDPLSAETDILAAKTVTSGGPYLAGSVVSYEITFTNRNVTPEQNVTLVDLLPPGMAYVTDSATLDGSATPAPTVLGRRLEWRGIAIPAEGTVTVQLQALLLDGAGSFVNEAFVLDSTGQQISNTATARVDVAPEAVFDCSDVIGKVFDDVNRNGYQDPPPDARAPITDQSYQGNGKFDTTPEVVDQQQRGEPGLPGVQIVTVRGDIITTDEYGRFSVPCALLPGPTGANFTLKLDERSLPTGYRVTTENPRTLRLTAGIMTEMNFGATLANLVEIDLLAAAFRSGSAQPNDAVLSGVDALVRQIADTPSVVRLTYYTNGESTETARARLRAVEDLIRSRWRGRYDLRIETTVARVQ